MENNSESEWFHDQLLQYIADKSDKSYDELVQGMEQAYHAAELEAAKVDQIVKKIEQSIDEGGRRSKGKFSSFD